MTKKVKPAANVTTKKDDAKVKKNQTFSVKDAPFETAMPDGFSFDTHKPIKRTHFAHDKYYFEHRALCFDHKAAMNRALAEEAAQFGSRKERMAAKKLQRMNSKIAELTAELKAAGVDVESILAAISSEE